MNRSSLVRDISSEENKLILSMMLENQYNVLIDDEERGLVISIEEISDE